MNKGPISTASTTINAPIATVWAAFVTPETIKQYMFGTDVVSEWKAGSPIAWKGDYHGTKYEDKGVILKIEPPHVLQYNHFSPLSGEPDVPEHYHTVTIELSAKNETTHVTLSQDNNPTEEERAHTAQSWQAMLDALKQLLEA